MSDSEYDLTKSSKALGKLYPILKAKDGSIIDGFHRQNADPDWAQHTLTIESVDTPVKLELARLATNFCRRIIPKSELEQRISFLIKNGLKVSEIAEQTGINESTIYRHLPQELKDQERSEATKKGIEEHRPLTCEVSGAIKREETVKIQETVQCDRCHVSTSTPVEWHNHKLCQTCHGKALADPETFNGYFSAVSKKPEPHAVLTTDTPRSLDKWEYRLGQMSPQHSKRELEFVELCTREDDLRPVITDRSFPLEETIPDAVFPKYNAVAYVDDPATHSGSRMDKDEALREKFLRRNPGWQVFVFRDGKPEDWVKELKLAVKAKMED